MTTETESGKKKLSRRMVFLGAAAVVLLVGLASPILLKATAKSTGPQTVVSMTFDDGWANQMGVLPGLQSHGYHATFYVISGKVGLPGRLTVANLHAIAAAGNEIAGHTTQHADLTTLKPVDQLRTICDDRVALTNMGFTVTDFAYPYGAYNAAVEQSVKECGYNSARATGGIGAGLSYAEKVPPTNPYAIKAVDSVVSTTTLSSLEATITAAMTHGGGWLPLEFHNECVACSNLAVTPANFNALLDWMKSQESHGLVVKTVAQVINQPAKPVVPGPTDNRPEATIVNPSLEQAASAHDSVSNSVLPYCFEAGGYGTNSGKWLRTNAVAHTGKWSEKVTVTSLVSGDRKLIIRRDEGTCAPGVVAGHSYTLGAWFKSNVPTRIVAYYGNVTGQWGYWAQSPVTPASAGWQHLTWTTPALPLGATHLSFGLQINGVGYLITDDYSMTTK